MKKIKMLAMAVFVSTLCLSFQAQADDGIPVAAPSGPMSPGAPGAGSGEVVRLYSGGSNASVVLGQAADMPPFEWDYFFLLFCFY